VALDWDQPRIPPFDRLRTAFVLQEAGFLERYAESLYAGDDIWDGGAWYAKPAAQYYNGVSWVS
ncbi:MAG: hypothetical protein H7842_12245, partial [Gammaproteobacteria bacterium SHHR-1]